MCFGLAETGGSEGKASRNGVTVHHGGHFPLSVCLHGTWADELDIAAVRQAVTVHKAVRIRNTGIREPQEFSVLAVAVLGELGPDLGEHPRATSDGAGVFAPVEFDRDQKLLWHNENSFDLKPPWAIAFCCLTPAEQGGATPIVLGSAVFDDLPGPVVERFMRDGVRYVRRFHPGIGRPWSSIFGTDDRDELAAICHGRGMDLEWRDGVLQTSAVRPAAHFDRSRSVWSWVNQAQHWHPRCLPAAVRDSMRAVFGAMPPRGCTFGDGEPIPDATMDRVLEAYARHEWADEWAAGDVLILDNLNAAHARNPYSGDRRLLVVLGGPTPIVTSAEADA